MKLLIQLTFNKGLGNLYCNIIELLDFATYYKKNGYQCELIFSSNGEKLKNKYINFIKFEDVFDVLDFKVFDSIRSFENSITDPLFEGMVYHSTNYGSIKPGIHSWDIFFHPQIKFLPYYMKMSTIETFSSGNFIPKFIPKFNPIIYSKVVNFINENNNLKKAVHIRNSDYIIHPNDNFKLITNQLYHILKKSTTEYHFLSNNQYIIDTITKLPNIKKYDFKNLEVLPNDHPYFHYYNEIDNNILLERFYDNITEMVILSYYDVIYHFTLVGPWVSTFLYYSIINNSNQKLINISNDLEIILKDVL